MISTSDYLQYCLSIADSSRPGLASQEPSLDELGRAAAEYESAHPEIVALVTKLSHFSPDELQRMADEGTFIHSPSATDESASDHLLRRWEDIHRADPSGA